VRLDNPTPSGSDYPTNAAGRSDAGRTTAGSILTRSKSQLKKLSVQPDDPTLGKGCVGLMLGAFCREHVWAIKASSSGPDDPTKYRTDVGMIGQKEKKSSGSDDPTYGLKAVGQTRRINDVSKRV